MDPSDRPESNGPFTTETLQTLATDGDEKSVCKYLKFINNRQRKLRFSKQSIEELKKVFKKASSRQKLKVQENGKIVERTVEAMNKEQFRS